MNVQFWWVSRKLKIKTFFRKKTFFKLQIPKRWVCFPLVDHHYEYRIPTTFVECSDWLIEKNVRVGQLLVLSFQLVEFYSSL